ncbi:histidine phosphatase family protein [Stakelama saccharophila]|uniref:Histidine phosphatase family protein n=1 Tax=Stakelama saccharophila TaxID=3075605 RepID=A0ABZ0B6I1_9SPHN|nr:histidine phosphatase family protein [Stakelama sp. W311]WNO52863.1 histidine phosphatase family protein [Stakelama sp. W311]
MNTRILLIRHAAHEDLGVRLTGRRCGVALTKAGHEQACHLAEHVAGEDIAALQASPTHRALQTAAIVGGRTGLGVQTTAALDEIDFGGWTGRRYAELERDSRWQAWNVERETGVTAGGESMAGVLHRLRCHLKRTSERFHDRTVAMVTHCDIIRTLVADILGLSLNAVHRFDIPPASVSRILAGDCGGKVISLNETLQ